MMVSNPGSSNPLVQLSELGQSPWIDYIRRDLMQSGELQRMIDEDGLRGMTSNPAIFEKSIASSADYDDLLSQYSTLEFEPKFIYEQIAIRDVRDAADVLMPVYQRTRALDGYVSLEVSPTLAHDTAGTIDEAHRLWSAVDRPNLMVKVPATPAGIPAIQALIADGININVTLLFAQESYEAAARAFITGLKQRQANGMSIANIASVASFFVSRIDSKIDALILERLKTASPSERELLEQLLGQVAIANARLAYQRYLRLFAGPEWEALVSVGAQPQRLLWASTSTKNPNYRDVLYVEQLIGPDTVNTLPPATFNAFRDHGIAADTLMTDVPQAEKIMDMLAEANIDMEQITDELLSEGVVQFEQAFENLIGAIEARPSVFAAVNPMRLYLPASLREAVSQTARQWAADDTVRRLWMKDATVWTGSDEASWLDWLTNAEAMLSNGQVEQFEAFQREIAGSGFSDVLLLGMGGSSLAPEVLRMTFGVIEGFPELHVLDSTDPQQIRSREAAIDMEHTLFIVASKSGGTLEPNIFRQYFFQRATEVLGDAAASHFVAITDPGSKMDEIARAAGYRHIFYGVPGIGGRYSALSAFGMVPGAAMGLDVRRLLERANEMVHATGSEVATVRNPGVVLGLVLGVAADHGRDKVTIIASSGIHDLGAWLEQLLAESTGKQGKGIIPVDRETPGDPSVYGTDRVFVYVRHAATAEPAHDAAIDALIHAGQPVVRIDIDDLDTIGAEWFRWEMATAAAGAVIGINPFDQPDVEAAKVVTRSLTSAYEETGSLPPQNLLYHDASGITLFADAGNAARLQAISDEKRLSSTLRALFSQVQPGDYIAFSAFIPMTDEHEALLQEGRLALRDHLHVATCLGFGPRFLHSTGQAYKGGPGTGVFLQITNDDGEDVPVPGQRYTFGVVKEAQARGDFEVLASRGRRALRVHLPADVSGGIRALNHAIHEALR